MSEIIVQLHNGTCQRGGCQTYDDAFELVKATYSWEFGAELPKNERPPKALVVINDGIVEATAGILPPNDPAALERGWPTEWYFGLEVTGRDQTFEIGKLAFNLRTAATAIPALVVAIAQYAREYGMEQAVACMKPPLLRILEKRMGITIHHSGLTPIPERVEPEFRGYFLEEGNLPEAVIFLRKDLNNYLASLEARIQGVVQSIEVCPHKGTSPRTLLDRVPTG